MTDSYASTDDLRTALGAQNTQGVDDRLALAVLVGTAYVDAYVSGTVSTVPVGVPYTVTQVPCPPAWRAAALVAAVRFYNSPNIPLGAATAGDYGRVIGNIPEADLMLRGHKDSWGIA